jgi:hypothetical protein
MIPYRFGKALRLERTARDRIRRIRGIAGRSVPYLVKRLTFIFGRRKISARVAWSMTEEVPLLLGRMDVFEKFRIIFDERSGVVDFREHQNRVHK